MHEDRGEGAEVTDFSVSLRAMLRTPRILALALVVGATKSMSRAACAQGAPVTLESASSRRSFAQRAARATLTTSEEGS
jgi:hypothetical protein